jgi:hypothetical protein
VARALSVERAAFTLPIGESFSPTFAKSLCDCPRLLWINIMCHRRRLF